MDGFPLLVPVVEKPSRVVEHLAHLDPAIDKLRTRRFDIRHDEVRPWVEPGSASIIPLPKMIEHAEPGGVRCTNRSRH